MTVARRDVVDARHGAQRFRTAFENGAHLRARQVPQASHGAGLHRDTLADDGDAVDELLHLGEDVAGQQNRTALGLDLPDRLGECGLHDRVEAAGRLVKQQQLSPRRERGDQRDPLP
jgi:hypothetical protein